MAQEDIDAVSGKVKDRYVPYRILVFLLYGTAEYLEHLDNGYIKIRTGPLARSMRYNYAYVKEQLKWLYNRGYLEDLTLDIGVALLKLKTPKLEEPSNNE